MITTERLHELLADNQAAHSDFQMDRFIIQANGLTTYGCYKQALRELDGRFHTMLDQWITLEGLRLDEADAAEHATDRRGQLALARIRLSIMAVEGQFSESKREFLRFLAHADHLKKQIGELTPERRAELEAEFWTEKIRRDGLLEMQSHGSASVATRRLFAMLSPEQKALAAATGEPTFPELPSTPAEMDVTAALKAATRKLIE